MVPSAGWLTQSLVRQVAPRMPRRFCLTGWTNGTGYFGLKIVRSVRDQVFGSLKGGARDRPYVSVKLPSMAPVCVRISPSFWRTCTEFRSAQIGAWMKQRGDSPWPPGRPPKYIGEFRVGDSRAGGLPLLKVSVPPRAV